MTIALLAEAIERDELLLRYQPIVRLAGSSIVGVEALLRWNPTGGPVAPEDFIGVAEETGLIVPIGGWVLQQACGQLARWQTSAHLPDLTMSVNVSAVQLRRIEFAAEVAAAVDRAGIAPATLILELTESVLMEDTAVYRDRFNSLKQLGVQLAVDDFGTGHSSLDYLRRFEFDVVKIDRSFTIDVPGGIGEARMARAVCDFVHRLGLSTTVEGIEQESQADFFAELGCARGQGYAFSPPIDVDAMAVLLERRSLLATTYGVARGRMGGWTRCPNVSRRPGARRFRYSSTRRASTTGPTVTTTASPTSSTRSTS